MATKKSLREFAEQAMRVERLLDERGVPGNAGRVVCVLRAAERVIGVTQQEVIHQTGLRKDAISKLVASLVRAGLLSHERDGTNPRMKRLTLTEDGTDLLSSIRTAIQTPREKETVKPAVTLFDDQE
ncbi:winged helix DNA-binding protein [Alloacidobacterium dinghuense]|uniref:Winged helix DNA-binding protein n=1 Tax=Alloacidobacterium dinghuense TaxID=2763107 RepID=A0A7G8BE87_9BACT|nr:MarR family transcriptional regulator [Alloacidobacterium dinghuense]QNI30857.1 winged helix DNA-binding protein [Alloacidobacterium dinghuense]